MSFAHQMIQTNPSPAVGGDEGEMHARHGLDHCRVGAEACRHREQVGKRLVEYMAA